MVRVDDGTEIPRAVVAIDQYVAALERDAVECRIVRDGD
jgi:hypothetical protein